jgi:hypothetical protein
VILIDPDQQAYKFFRKFILMRKGAPGVPNGPNLQNLDNISSWLFANLQKSASKQPTKMPKITLDNLRKKVKTVEKILSKRVH